jgi:hypothetical protein
LIGQQADHSVASIPTLRQDEEKVSEPKSSLSSRLSSATDNEKVYFLLQHANSLSNTQMDEASAEQIILYKNFKKATDESYFKQAIELESKELKDAVILKIETKIESLKKQKTPYEISKQTQSLEELDLYYKNEKINKEITLLTNLKTQIFNAAPTQNLFTTVNLWLETNKLDDNNKLKSFINDLEEKNEMSPYFLNYMRASVLLQLKHMFLDRSWDSLSKQSPEIELLKKAILNFEDNQSTFKDLLLKLKKIVSEVHLDKAKHVDLMQFYTCLSDINPYDGHRLRLTVKKLFNFDHEFIMQKVLVPTVETPPPAITSTQNEQDNTAKQQGQDIVVKIHFGK